jgi:4-amino-4-deoxy-L-arabinose transferase-like glycosyltransferase
MRPWIKQAAFLVLLAALLAVPRLVAIDRFATIDEPYWLTAGADFYYALGQRAFANTVYDYHPAVTTMWILTAAMLIYFPQYRGFGQGYFDVYKDTLEQFLLAHGRTPLGLLATGRIVQVLVLLFLLLVLFWFLRRLLGSTTAWAATLLIGFDPFFLGNSRLLNHEGMLSLFVLISLLAVLLYQSKERRFVYLLISGAAAGFGQLTKSSSIVLEGVVGLLFVIDLFARRQEAWRPRLLRFARDLGAWLGALALIYFVFWPGMWVAPGEMLYQVFGNALSYALEGSRLSVTGGIEASRASLNPAGIFSMVPSLLWRTTPIVWLGFLLGLLAAIRQKGLLRVVCIAMVGISLAFIILFGVAQGRDSPHYLMTAYVALDIVAAMGFVYAAGWLAERVPVPFRRMALPTALVLVVALQALSALPFFPYYYTYYNPIVEAMQPGRQNMDFGYGEGLELAASYLAQEPDAASTTVMAYDGFGPFSFFYPGNTEQLKRVYADAQNVPELIRVLQRSRYLVLYYELQRVRNSPPNVMRALQDIPPQKSIWLNDIEYIRIYRVDMLPQAFYAALEP